jgi:hypothetical protein
VDFLSSVASCGREPQPRQTLEASSEPGPRATRMWEVRRAARPTRDGCDRSAVSPEIEEAAAAFRVRTVFESGPPGRGRGCVIFSGPKGVGPPRLEPGARAGSGPANAKVTKRTRRRKNYPGLGRSFLWLRSKGEAPAVRGSANDQGPSAARRVGNAPPLNLRRTAADRSC